jgi:hypothetical protein
MFGGVRNLSRTGCFLKTGLCQQGDVAMMLRKWDVVGIYLVNGIVLVP